jgi:hypothetical protein
MIKTECYGGGTRWYCEKCDTYHNGYVQMIRFTNSTPPAYCTKCESPADAQKRLEEHANKAMWTLMSIYGLRFYIPGSNSKIAELIRAHGLQGRWNSHRVAAIINRTCQTI